ncbi:unnamed protein product [Symbiodinium sp. CCMP2592]|nr:unnamed protein product [Symbiodinium sp. CCMP2592]
MMSQATSTGQWLRLPPQVVRRPQSSTRRPALTPGGPQEPALPLGAKKSRHFNSRQLLTLLPLATARLAPRSRARRSVRLRLRAAEADTKLDLTQVAERWGEAESVSNGQELAQVCALLCCVQRQLGYMAAHHEGTVGVAQVVSQDKSGLEIAGEVRNTFAPRTLVRRRPVPWSRRLALASHHATCPEFRRRLISSMGRSRAKRGGQAREDVEDPQWRDHLWRGAYSPAQRPWRSYADKGKPEKEQPAPPRFPTYQSMHVRDPANGPGKGAGKHPNVAVEEAPGSVMGLQPVLNTARKAELRVQRLVANRDRARRQWEAYDAELKQTFMREKKKFSANLERLNKDITEALHAQDLARRAVCQTVNGQPVAESEMAANEEMEWERTRSAWEQDEGSDLHGVLHRAMTHADAADGLSRPRLMSGAPPGFGVTDASAPAQILRMADEMRAASAASGVDPYYGTALNDPYQGSPSGAYLKAQGPATSPSARVAPYDTGHAADRREDGPSLASRVEHKRSEATGGAMRPFGLPPATPPPAPGFATVNGGALQIPIASDDELDTANTAAEAGEPPP